MKTEFLTPYHYNTGKRGWTPVFLEINSTEINFYSLNVDKKFAGVLESLFVEANLLHDLAAHIRDHRLKKEGLGLEEVDLFGEDPYGAAFHPEEYHQSPSDRFRLKFQKAKNGAAARFLPKFYGHLKDNGFLFEPTSDPIVSAQFRAQYGGQLIHSYTLAGCVVGEAPSLNQVISAMYKETLADALQSSSTLVKYKNVLRLRVELKQILLQFWSFYGMVHWYRLILIGCDLASPLESRGEVRFKSIPSRQTRLNNALLVATAAASSMSRGQNEADTGDWAAHNAADGNFEDIPEGEVCFNDPFLATSPLKLTTRPCSCSESDSVCSSPDSVFSGRRHSVVTAASASSDACPYTKTMHSYKLVSYDKYYTTLEKQYITNCIPDLNLFDKWQSMGVTLLNFEHYMSKLQLKQYTKDPKNVYISVGELLDGVTHYNKSAGTSGACRRFVVHQSGLVSVA